MPNICVICKNKGQYEMIFHHFPKDKNLCNIWIHNIGLKDTSRLSQKRICSDHFDPTCYLLNTNRLKLNAVPKLFTPVEMNSVTTETVDVQKCATPPSLEHIDVTNDSILSPVELFPLSPELLPGCSKNCSTLDISSRLSSSCSTPCSDSETQAGLVLSQNTPRKMKLKKRLRYTEIQLKSALKECDNLKTINANLQDRLDGPVTLSDFNNMCTHYLLVSQQC
ncbi:uncharacterized protein LOC112599149 [Melanaphis sacchari]|uniref:uncharacterized protein LOC112599149 n=1 Tax=Melanaphis sacchari TaxID=742174 RepID=UPI000DC1538A|nr:uncharacterized protein LOC112599149 [Melanaphis sacchari]